MHTSRQTHLSDLAVIQQAHASAHAHHLAEARLARRAARRDRLAGLLAVVRRRRGVVGLEPQPTPLSVSGRTA